MDLGPEKLAELARLSGDPWLPTNAYFTSAEEHMDALWDRLIWPFISDCDFSRVVDLAAGHGRNSEKLLPLVTDQLFITDIQPGNVEVCARRFAWSVRVVAFVGNGFDFLPLDDATLSLIYCFDAMVHFDSDIVRSYLRDARRVLQPGGRGFFHHSNYTGGDDWTRNPSSRGFMSSDFFAHYARKEGLDVVRQQVIDWGNHRSIDCLTLVERPG